MKLLEKIIELVYLKPKEKELKNKCEIFLYPETAQKLKMIEKILEEFEKQNNGNFYRDDYETRRAELFRKIIGIAHFILYQFSENNKVVIVEKKRKKSKNLWLSSCLKRAN